MNQGNKAKSNVSKKRQRRPRRRYARKGRAKNNLNPNKRQAGNPPIAYKSKNTIIGPRIINVDGQTVRIKHREFVTAIQGNGNPFSITKTINLNPGLPESFPWLYQTARAYESYRMERFQIEFVPTVPTTTPGSVSFMIDYDASDLIPDSEKAFKNSQGCTTVPVWNKAQMTSMAEQLNKSYYSRYTRSGNLAENLDIKTYDFGNLFVATEGAVMNNKIGDLYFSYDLLLLTPQLAKREVQPGDGLQHFKSSSTSPLAPFTGATAIGDPIFALQDGKTFKALEEGKYMLEFVTAGTAITNYQFVPDVNALPNKLLVGLLGAGGNKIVNNCIFALKAGETIAATLNSGALSGSDLYASKLSNIQYEAIMEDVLEIYPVQ